MKRITFIVLFISSIFCIVAKPALAAPRCGLFNLGVCIVCPINNRNSSRCIDPGYSIDDPNAKTGGTCPKSVQGNANSLYLCEFPINTCSGSVGVNTNGYCEARGADCAGSKEIPTSQNTCAKQFSNEGYNNNNGSIRCCSTTTSANGTPIIPSPSLQNPCPNNQCKTAIGNINVSTGSSFVNRVFQIILGLSGGTALLLFIYSGFNMEMSQGNPEKVKAAQETLTAAIIGLVFIILSLVILQIIGVNILQLPGFTNK